jgi:uncharacterized protein DUF397
MWRKSSRSEGGNTNCVEVALTPSAVLVRDSKHTAAVLRFPFANWQLGLPELATRRGVRLPCSM